MWAHSVNVCGQRHRLSAHLRATAGLARGFAVPFGAGDLAAALGLLHDAGKAGAAWQRRLVEVEVVPGQRVGIDHKRLGAQLVSNAAGPGAMAILGHHGGLGDLAELHEVAHDVVDAETRDRLVAEVPETSVLINGAEALLPAAWRRDRMVLEMGLRLTFSALVDADYLDTAAHFAGTAGPVVGERADMPALLDRFEAARRATLAGRFATPVDAIRHEVYEAATRAAAGLPGVYRLSAPTGSGKTLAAAGFALRHAAAHGMGRVIVAVPFITITEQNAAVYRDLLGSEVVVEHHSNVDGDEHLGRLGAENWDAPFVVTTTVQLFDSMFGRKPSRCRKVHRLSNAVIVLDEVQSLPPQLLLPILDGLRLLCEHFGATVLLTSATQPAFQRLSVWRQLDGAITEVIPDPAGLSARLRRVRYEWRLDPQPELAQVADEVRGLRQVLVVMNTVGDARRMYRLLAESGVAGGPVRHLSTRMCPAHRRAVLAEVRELLAAGQPVALVSTQLIEAGVDVDFPVVFRDLAPADSLQQAAGRANREGRHAGPGRVVVFRASDTSSPPSYRTPVAQTVLRFGPGLADPDDVGALDRYYTALYAALNLENARRGTTIQRNRSGLNFRSVADGPLRDLGAVGAPDGGRDRGLAFRMLDDDSTPVAITTWDGSERVERLLDGLRTGAGPLREAFRAVQPHIVALPTRVADRPDVRALLSPVVGDLLQWRGVYDPQVGIDEDATGVATVW